MATVDVATNLPLIAQEITCYYPISDLYAPTPRYLYYVLLVLSVITPRHGWVAHIILGAAIAYAATAAIEAFILLSAPLTPHAPQSVTIPYVSSTNLTDLLTGIQALVTDTSYVSVQPDYLELDVDAVTCIVIAAYLVGLPLQCWSSTARTSRILHLLVLLWNLVMLAGSISVLILWPKLNVSPLQFRFCYAGIDDGDTTQNDGWENEYWAGSWNTSVWDLFGTSIVENDRWWNLSTNCFYPCFNTSQILRDPKRLTATVFGPHAPGANFHTWDAYKDDEFQPLIYAAIATFTAAQLFLLTVGRLHLCTDRVPIYRPFQLWFARKVIFHSFMSDFKIGCSIILETVRKPRPLLHRIRRIRFHHMSRVKRIHKHPLFHFVMDLVALIVLTASMILGPLTIIAFIVWIEIYIHADGEPNEEPQAVGQWAFVIQVAIVLLAALLLRLRYKVASVEEVENDIERAKLHVTKLEGIAERKRTHREARAVQSRGKGGSLVRMLTLKRSNPGDEKTPGDSGTSRSIRDTSQADPEA